MRILFLCTGNSCRSQMAEGWARHLKHDVFTAYSAGIVRHGLNPYAMKVMAEAGVDMSGHTSKTVDELPAGDIDVVVTLCGHANETCPFFPGRAGAQGVRRSAKPVRRHDGRGGNHGRVSPGA
jgi:arsenate reductase